MLEEAQTVIKHTYKSHDGSKRERQAFLGLLVQQSKCILSLGAHCFKHLTNFISLSRA